MTASPQTQYTSVPSSSSPSSLLHTINSGNDLHLGYSPRENQDQNYNQFQGRTMDIDNKIEGEGTLKNVQNRRNTLPEHHQNHSPRTSSILASSTYSQNNSSQFDNHHQQEQALYLSPSISNRESKSSRSFLDTKYDQHRESPRRQSLVAQGNDQPNSAVPPWLNRDKVHEENRTMSDGNANVDIFDSKDSARNLPESVSTINFNNVILSNASHTYSAQTMVTTWNRSSLRNEIMTSELTSSSTSSSSTPTISNSVTHSDLPYSPSFSFQTPSLSALPSPSLSSSTLTTKALPSSQRRQSSLSSSLHISSNLSPTILSEKTSIPTPISSSPPTGNSYDDKQFDGRILSREAFSSTSTLRDSYDQAVGTDTGSTFATDTGQRHEFIQPIVERKEDQEVTKAATARAAQGGHSGIMGAGAYHANETAAGTAMKGVDVERLGVAATFAGVASEGKELANSRHPFVKNISNIMGSSSKSQLREYEPQIHNSSPSPTSQFYKDPFQPDNHSQSSYTSKIPSESHRKKSIEGLSASSSSLSSSTASPHFSAGTSDSIAPSILRPSSPSMNNHPVSFDQTDQSYHLPFYTNSTIVSSNNISSSLNNKRRSLADLLFVPTKSIKIKEKRNSFSASSVSSVESYRQDEAIEPYTGRPIHPKSASTPSVTSTPLASSNQIMSLDTHSSPPTRKSSTTKAGKGGSGLTSSPKTFQCTGYPGCNMVFTRSEHLARHERKHTGEKPYKCIVPSCPRTFSRFDNMMQHTQTHGDRTKRDSLAGATAGGGRSRSSSMHSTPLATGRPRGGSSPGVFSPGYEDPHFRGLQSSPVPSHLNNTPFVQQQQQQQLQQRHPYSPHYHPQPHQSQYNSQWGYQAGASAPMANRNSSPSGGGGQQYLPHSGPGPTTPVVRTLKANSRSLPHLQPRSSHGGSVDGPSGMQYSFTSNETEELRRRKSEILLPSSYSAARAMSVSGSNDSQSVGLGMSAFPPGNKQSHMSSPMENSTLSDQNRLNEHRRSAHASLNRMNAASTGSIDQRAISDYMDQSPSIPSQNNPSGRLGGLNPSIPPKDQMFEHRKSTPDVMFDGRYSKRSSNDPTDMVIQPLPSRDSRSGSQWFSQVNTPNDSSAGLMPSILHDGSGSNTASQGGQGDEDDHMSHLPPILGRHDRHDDNEQFHNRQSRPRSHSSHVHPLSHPQAQNSLFDSLGPPLWSLSDDLVSKDRNQFDPTLSPRFEHHLEERYYPVRKGEVLNTIERMDNREFLGLKAQVAESFANEQFRNPEFLSNMTSVLCVIRAPHSSWKNPGNSTSGHSKKDIEMDQRDGRGVDPTAQGYSMDIDVHSVPIDRRGQEIVQPCRYALDIDIESFGRDPEQDIRSLESLTINSLFPTKSFVAGFEHVMENRTQDKKDRNDAETEENTRFSRGYPSNARIGRFYLPDRAFRTPDSLNVRPDPNGSWISCQFEEFQNVSIWVLESVLEKYNELSRRHKMALTLIGAPVHHSVPVYDHDEWEIHNGEQYDVKVEESMLFPEMMHQVWKDIHRQYFQQQKYQQQQQQQQHHQHQHQQHLSQHHHQLPPHQSSIQSAYHPLTTHPAPSHMSNRVTTYEEYQKSLIHGEVLRESHAYQHGHSYPNLRASASAGLDHYYNDYRQHQPNIHLEDLSSAPSSPSSLLHDDLQEDGNQAGESVNTTPRQYQELVPISSANMHRRISIAELCNPMQSLATEKERQSSSD